MHMENQYAIRKTNIALIYFEHPNCLLTEII